MRQKVLVWVGAIYHLWDIFLTNFYRIHQMDTSIFSLMFAGHHPCHQLARADIYTKNHKTIKL
jgi:hypothetical protein